MELLVVVVVVFDNIVLLVLWWADCEQSPTFILVVTLLLVLEGLMFGLFTAIMCGSQLSAICSDETVILITGIFINDMYDATILHCNPVSLLALALIS